MSTDNPRPRVVLISIDPASPFEGIHHRLLAELRSRASVETVKDQTQAVELLADKPLPSAILITDAELTLPEHAHVWEAVLNCVRQGCTAVVAGSFSAFAQYDSVKPFFSKAGLSWDPSAYTRATWTVNQAALGSQLAAKLPARYYQKALFLGNVAFSDAWYTADYTSQPFVVGSSNATNYGESAVAMARVADGKLGYLGDVNSEKENDAIILAMCDLLDDEYGMEELA